jgi:hypothetical protein
LGVRGEEEVQPLLILDLDSRRGEVCGQPQASAGLYFTPETGIDRITTAPNYSYSRPKTQIFNFVETHFVTNSKCRNTSRTIPLYQSTT